MGHLSGTADQTGETKVHGQDEGKNCVIFKKSFDRSLFRINMLSAEFVEVSSGKLYMNSQGSATE